MIWCWVLGWFRMFCRWVRICCVGDWNCLGWVLEGVGVGRDCLIGKLGDNLWK